MLRTGGTVKSIQHDAGGLYTVTVAFTDPAGEREFRIPDPGPAEFLEDFREAMREGYTLDVDQADPVPPATDGPILRVTQKA